MGYLVGTVVNVVFVAIWYLGARKGIKANSLMLLLITVGGFPIRLGILILFAFGGLYLFQMNTIYFAIAFLVGTIFSLVIEVWFFNNLKFPTTKHQIIRGTIDQTDPLSKRTSSSKCRDLKPGACSDRRLRGFEINYKSLVEDSPGVIYILDAKEPLVYQNWMCRDLFSPSTSRWDATISITCPGGQSGLGGVQRRSREAPPVNNEDEDARQGRLPLYFISTSVPQELQGAVMGLLAVMRNITQMHYMEKMLGENSSASERSGSRWGRPRSSGIKALNEESSIAPSASS